MTDSLLLQAVVWSCVGLVFHLTLGIMRIVHVYAEDPAKAAKICLGVVCLLQALVFGVDCVFALAFLVAKELRANRSQETAAVGNQTTDQVKKEEAGEEKK